MSGLAVLGLLALVGCGADQDWTPEQIGNAEQIFAALDADRRAAEIENLGLAGFDDRGEEEASLEHRQRALDLSRAVRDEVLAKAHPELPLHFRAEFERSQALFLTARRERRPDLETRAIQLRNRFGDWYVRQREQIRIPPMP